MNKIKISLVSVIIILFISCNSNSKKCVEINYKNIELPVILRLGKYKNKNFIRRIQFSNKITMRNNSFFCKDFSSIDYHYNKTVPIGRNLDIELYKQEKGKLVRISNNKKRNIPVIGNLEYVFYTRHFVDSTKHLQKQLKPYLEKMLQQGKDTLHIGTVAKFKQTHMELFEMLTKNDSISIYLLDDKTKSGLGERIAVPVVW